MIVGDAFWVRFNLRGLEGKGEKEKWGKSRQEEKGKSKKAFHLSPFSPFLLFYSPFLLFPLSSCPLEADPKPKLSPTITAIDLPDTLASSRRLWWMPWGLGRRRWGGVLMVMEVDLVGAEAVGDRNLNF